MVSVGKFIKILERLNLQARTHFHGKIVLSFGLQEIIICVVSASYQL